MIEDRDLVTMEDSLVANRRLSIGSKFDDLECSWTNVVHYITLCSCFWCSLCWSEWR